jgi:hypothetical protein
MSPKRRRVLLMDMQREDDEVRMETLCRNLRSLRPDKHHSSAKKV